jgi:hypothetical protein
LAITIQRLSDSQIEAAKAVIVQGCHELFGQPPAEFEDMDRIYGETPVKRLDIEAPLPENLPCKRGCMS